MRIFKTLTIGFETKCSVCNDKGELGEEIKITHDGILLCTPCYFNRVNKCLMDTQIAENCNDRKRNNS